VARADVLEALEVDHVLSRAQLRRHYRARREVLEKLPSVTRTLVPVHMRSSSRVTLEFYGLNQRTLDRARTSHLAHLAGTAELRHVLGVPVSSWHAEARHGYDVCNPDAQWFREDGTVTAVEYDSGTYTFTDVTNKLLAFREQGHHETIWGVVSRVRGDRLRLRSPEKLEVKVLNWWE